MNTKKAPQCKNCGAFWKLVGYDVLATTTELRLELLDAASGVDEALLTCEGRVRIGSDVADHDLIFYAVDSFCLATTHSGTSQIFRASRNVDEGNRVELWMDFSFHGKKIPRLSSLALTRFKARV